MNYNEPGNENELSAEQRELWIKEQSNLFEIGISVAKDEVNPRSEKAWIFNPINTSSSNFITSDIKWNAFPKRLMDQFGSKLAAWREGDRTRDRHEEYCEWEVVRDSENTVLKVTFTTEAPEYYIFLYQTNKQLLLDLYHNFVSPEVKLSDLETLVGGQIGYNRRNIWNYPEKQNKRGVLMHMGFGPNTLGAAINLSAEATWPSVDSNGNAITDEQGLIDCRGYGARERHSDPHIGAEINALIRLGNEISFAGPTGLYIDEIDLSNFEVPNGVKAEDLMRVTRGEKDFKMRVVFEAPKDSGFRLGDVRIDGNKIAFGGQIAEKITVRIRGIAKLANELPSALNCNGLIAKPSLENLGANIVGTRRSAVEFISSLG